MSPTRTVRESVAEAEAGKRDLDFSLFNRRGHGDGAAARGAEHNLHTVLIAGHVGRGQGPPAEAVILRLGMAMDAHGRLLARLGDRGLVFGGRGDLDSRAATPCV